MIRMSFSVITHGRLLLPPPSILNGFIDGYTRCAITGGYKTPQRIVSKFKESAHNYPTFYF